MRVFLYILYTLSVLSLKAFAICLLWSWYITEYFDIKPITFAESFGLVLIQTLLSFLPLYSYNDYEHEFKHNLTVGIKPLVILLIGWVIHIIIML